MKLITSLFLSLFLLFSFACSTSDSSLRETGHSEAYTQGFHDGRHSGMQEQGNYFENYIKDNVRFSADSEYKLGWLDGESEGKKLQSEAASIGEGIAAGQTQQSIDAQNDPEKTANEVLKNTDTSELKNLQ
ncbi:MAG: hypothetical protein V7782_11625 [Psychromonas sp.]